ncbi:MAG: calcium/proton exchanger [Nanoarchaeota archaeon]
MSETKQTDKTIETIFLVLLVAVPLSWMIKLMDFNPVLLFITSAIATIPLTRLISETTAKIADNSSSAFGAFINAALGNITEVMIAIFAIAAGLIVIVKAAIIGSLLANLLFLLGASLFLGGLRYKEQRFNTETAGIASTMLIIAFAGFTIPSIFALGYDNAPVETISMLVSAVLIVVYILGVVFTFFTHKHLFQPIRSYSQRMLMENWGKGKTFSLLALGVSLLAIETNLLVSSLEPTIKTYGLPPIFMGVVVLGIIGNIGEMASAMSAAIKNNVNLSIGIAVGSSTQIAMFVVPVLVFVSMLMGNPLTLVFPLFHILAVLFAVMIVNYLSSDGRCNWLEGVQLLSVYFIIAVVFFFVK